MAAGARTIVFSNAGVVQFQNGPALKEKRIGSKRTWAGTTPDGAMSIFGFDMKGWLQTAKTSFAFPAAHVDRAIWGDGRVAVLQHLAAAVVLDTATGKVVYQRSGHLECDARMVGDNLWLHEQSKDPKARLYRVDLKTGIATVLSSGRRVDQCAATADGQRWMLFNDYANEVSLLSATGESVPLVSGQIESVRLSPTGDRVCFVQQLSVVCRRGDRTEERVASDIVVADMEIDPMGARMMIRATYPVKGEPVPVILLADFASATVRELRGPSLRSGGSLRLLSGGRAVAAGSSTGVEVFEVESGKHHTLAHNAMYTVKPLPGAERKLIGEEDNGGDTFLIELP